MKNFLKNLPRRKESCIDMENEIYFGDCREGLKYFHAKGIKARTCVTSPPYYGLRSYGVNGELGQEETPQKYVETMVDVLRNVRDVLTDDGTVWLNIGDSYAAFRDGKVVPDHLRGECTGTRVDISRNRMPASFKGTSIKHKDLIGIPWRLAFALQDDGWHLRQDIIWAKPNPAPESVKDRCTRAHEYIFFLTKNEKYYFDYQANKEPAVIGGERNRRSVWEVATRPYKDAHFATFPSALIEPCILTGSEIGDVVLDPFMGSGTTAEVAVTLGRKYIGCELNREYEKLQTKRLKRATTPESSLSHLFKE
jgi:DNA modification methylase